MNRKTLVLAGLTAVALVAGTIFVLTRGGPLPQDPEGSYSVTISTAELEEGAPVFADRVEPETEWSLQITGDQYTLISDAVGEFSELLTIEDHRIVIRDFGAPQGVFVCHDEAGNRLAAPKKGTGVYDFLVAEDGLHLESESEECPLRAFLLERVWEPID